MVPSLLTEMPSEDRFDTVVEPDAGEFVYETADSRVICRLRTAESVARTPSLVPLKVNCVFRSEIALL